MDHTLSKTLIIINVTELIAEKYRVSIEEAREQLYNSKLIKLIENDDAELYGESPLYVFSLFEQEKSHVNGN